MFSNSNNNKNSYAMCRYRQGSYWSWKISKSYEILQIRFAGLEGHGILIWVVENENYLWHNGSVLLLWARKHNSTQSTYRKG